MRFKPEHKERIQLRTMPRGKDLDGYLFSDKGHAVRWLKQGPFAKQNDWRYRVAIVTAHQTRVGEDRVTKVHRKMKPSQFLEEFDK